MIYVTQKDRNAAHSLWEEMRKKENPDLHTLDQLEEIMGSEEVSNDYRPTINLLKDIQLKKAKA